MAIERDDLRPLLERAWSDVDGASLAALRILFGLVMVLGTVRFVSKGWVNELYLAPTFHFTYWPFDFIRPLPGLWLYAVFALMGVAAFGVMIGAFYRLSIGLFFVCFTYIELLDVSTYLNHYYLVSLLAFLLLFMPAHRVASIDAWRASKRGEAPSSAVPAFVLWLLRGQIGVVYFFAGLAKLNGDWLFRAQPLATWLPVHADLPLVGPLMDEAWMAFAMSWAGALFDLTVAPLLSLRRTRLLAYAAVVGFHLATGALFRIGVFPFVMIAVTTIFFDPSWPRRVFSRLGPAPLARRPRVFRAAPVIAAALFFCVQVLVPLRQHLYPGMRLWTEQGYRFAWNVMLIEKTGDAVFEVREPRTGRRWIMRPRAELSQLQLEAMSTQPDLILQYARHLAERFRRERGLRVEVRAEVWASLNGRRMQRLIDPDIDLARQRDGLAPKPWIVPLREER